MSARVFLLVNLPIIFLTLVENHFFSTEVLINRVFVEFSKSVLFITLMDALAKKEHIEPKCKRITWWTPKLLLATALTDLVKTAMAPNCANSSTSMIVALFKPFFFEMIFDLVHYFFHRVAHSSRLIYVYVHKQHHEYAYPSAYTTFYMSPIDVFFSSSVPLLVASLVTAPTLFELALYQNYLRYQEIGGHLGKQMRPTSSFPQFTWLPKWLGIELNTEDHDLHHSSLSCNFSKRFKLWDVVFGTFRS